jgi:hypothetical protein
MQQFTLTLKDNTQKAFNTFSWFLLLLHVVIISVIIMNAADVYHRNVAWGTGFLLSLFCFGFFFFRFKLIIFQSGLFALITGFWLAQQAWLPAIILSAIVFFARFVLKKESVATFSDQHVIIIKSIFKKEHSWLAIENVILKDHLLSIDFKNNHLLQLEITAESYTIDETIFNQFCRQQLAQNPSL